MSDDKASGFNKVLAGLVACLVLVTAVQGYFLYRVWHSGPNVAYAASKDDPSKEWSVAPDPKAAPDAISIPLNKPSDPNAWNPFKEMEEMQKQMDHMFDQAFGRFGASPQFKGFMNGSSFNPTSDMEENDHEYIVHVDLPGTDASKIEATLKDQTLTISGTREDSVSQQGAGKQLRQERRLGKFERMITLPTPVKQEGMKTDYKDGVLTITIPKDIASKSTSIHIQ